MKFTILGGNGFIGSNLVEYLKSRNIEVTSPRRDDHHSIFTGDLGHVIYTIGLTADFRQRPFDTVEAHVCLLSRILQKAKFDSLLYLSSSRIYYGSTSGNEEGGFIVTPQNPSDLYNLSKMMGESICFSQARADIRVARLSNIYGNDFESDNFLPSIIRDALKKKKITLSTSLQSEKDYLSVQEVAHLLVEIVLKGKKRLYNVASGCNIRNESLIDIIKRRTGCDVEVAHNAPTISFPIVNVQRIKDEFKFSPTSLLDSLDHLIDQY